MRKTKIGRYVIDWDDVYYIAYAGGYRELKADEAKEYNKTLALPELLRIKEQRKIGFDKNPNVFPISGIKLVELFRERDFLPFFDPNFESSHLLQVNDIFVFESMKAKSYEVVLDTQSRIKRA